MEYQAVTLCCGAGVERQAGIQMRTCLVCKKRAYLILKEK